MVSFRSCRVSHACTSMPITKHRNKDCEKKGEGGQELRKRVCTRLTQKQTVNSLVVHEILQENHKNNKSVDFHSSSFQKRVFLTNHHFESPTTMFSHTKKRNIEIGLRATHLK